MLKPRRYLARPKGNQLLITIDTKQEKKQFIIFCFLFFCGYIDICVSLLSQMQSTYHRLTRINNSQLLNPYYVPIIMLDILHTYLYISQ